MKTKAVAKVAAKPAAPAVVVAAGTNLTAQIALRLPKAEGVAVTKGQSVSAVKQVRSGVLVKVGANPGMYFIPARHLKFFGVVVAAPAKPSVLSKITSRFK